MEKKYNVKKMKIKILNFFYNKPAASNFTKEKRQS